jgi:hypothetical protein
MKFKTIRKCLCQYCAYPLTDPKAMEEHEANCFYRDVDWSVVRMVRNKNQSDPSKVTYRIVGLAEIANKLGCSRQRVWYAARRKGKLRQVKPIDKKRAA